MYFLIETKLSSIVTIFVTDDKLPSMMMKEFSRKNRFIRTFFFVRTCFLRHFLFLFRQNIFSFSSEHFSSSELALKINCLLLRTFLHFPSSHDDHHQYHHHNDQEMTTTIIKTWSSPPLSGNEDTEVMSLVSNV